MTARLAVVGGTGKEGRGLVTRFAAAGWDVLLGSRSAERAARATDDVRARLTTSGRRLPRIESGENCAVIPRADVVVLTVPFAALDDLLDQCGEQLTGKIVVDVTVPLRMTDGRFEIIPVAEGSASAHVQARVPEARVVAAFKNVAADHLLRLDRTPEGDIPVAGDVAAAKTVVTELTRGIPALRPIDVGPLANAGMIESLTALELNVNRLHRAVTSIRFLGVR